MDLVTSQLFADRKFALGNANQPSWGEFGVCTLAGLILWIVVSLAYPLQIFIVTLLPTQLNKALERELERSARIEAASMRSSKLDGPGDDKNEELPSDISITARWTRKREKTHKYHNKKGDLTWNEKYRTALIRSNKWKQRNKVIYDEKFGLLPVLVLWMLNCIIVVIFVIDSFLRDVSPASNVFYFILSISTTIYNAAELIFLPSPSSNVLTCGLSMRVIMECFSLPSMWGVAVGLWSYTTLTFLRIMCSYYYFSMIVFPTRSPDSYFPIITRMEGFVWVVFFLCVFFVLASSFVITENLGNINTKWNGNTDVWNGVNGIYYMFVTLSSVGYGDFLPTTYQSLVFITITILGVLFYIGWRISGIIGVVQSIRSGGGSYNPMYGSSHVVITGSFSRSSLRAIAIGAMSDIHPGSRILHYVLFSEGLEGWSEDDIESVLRSRFGKFWIKFIKGSPYSPYDLYRAAVPSAEAIFIKAPLKSDDFRGLDKSALTMTNAIREVNLFSSIFLNINKRCYLRAAERAVTVPSGTATGSIHFRKYGDVVCRETVMAGYLSMSIEVDGFSTLLINLISSISPVVAKDDLPWTEEYKQGAQQTLRLIRFGQGIIGVHTNRFWKLVYEQTGSIVVGVLSMYTGFSFIHDVNRVLTPDDVACLVICSDVMYSLFSLVDFFETPSSGKEDLEFRRLLLSHMFDRFLRTETPQLAEMMQQSRDDEVAAIARDLSERVRENSREPSLGPISLSRKKSVKSDLGAEYRDHVIICGFSQECIGRATDLVHALRKTRRNKQSLLDGVSLSEQELDLLRELGESNAEPFFLCLIDAPIHDILDELNKIDPKLVFYEGDPTSEEDLKALNPELADTILLLEPVEVGVDSKSFASRILFSSLAIDKVLPADSSTRVLFESDLSPDNITFIQSGRQHTVKEAAKGNHDLPRDHSIHVMKTKAKNKLRRIHRSFSHKRQVNALSLEKISHGRKVPEVSGTQDHLLSDNAMHASERISNGQVILRDFIPVLLGAEILLPGVSWFVHKACGISDDSKSLPCIRLWSLTSQWTGKSYGELVLFLYQYGLVALGLYRSGEAPVLVDCPLLVPPEGPMFRRTKFVPENEQIRRLLADPEDEDYDFVRDYCTPPKNHFMAESSYANMPYVVTNPPSWTVLSEHDAVYLCISNAATSDIVSQEWIHSFSKKFGLELAHLKQGEVDIDAAATIPE